MARPRAARRAPGAGAVDAAGTPRPRPRLDDRRGSSTDLVRDAWRGKDGARAVLFWHLIECVPVLIWVVGVCGMPLWVYLAAFVYPGMSLAMVRSFAEHRAAPKPEKRTAIVENARILGPLFLFNNLHVAHHLRGGLPWYQIPTFYRLNRAALIERNGGLVYRSYFDVARRYLLTPHDRPVHPGLEPAAPHERERADRGAADVRFSGDRRGERRAVGGDRGAAAGARRRGAGEA